MASRHARIATVPEYQFVHVTATGTAVPVGNSVGTTAPTTITAGSVQTITPASMLNISQGMMLNFAGGVGTAEDVQVISITSTTFNAFFANAHSGAYTISSHRGQSRDNNGDDVLQRPPKRIARWRGYRGAHHHCKHTLSILRLLRPGVVLYLIRHARRPDHPIPEPFSVRKKDTMVTTKPTDERKSLALQIHEIDDDCMYTCLWGYSKVLPTAHSWLDEFSVTGGVINSVPGKRAKDWKRNRATAAIIVLPDDATEADFMQASGVRPEDMAKLVNQLMAINPHHIISQLGPARARSLAESLKRQLDER
jgi:hypothetical protein